MSGSSLSPWAIVKEPVQYAITVAAQLNCKIPETLFQRQHLDNLHDCLRTKSIEEILQVSFIIQY